MLDRIRNAAAMLLANIAASLHTAGAAGVVGRLIKPTGGGGPTPVEPK